MPVEVYAGDEQAAHSIDLTRWVKLVEDVFAAEGIVYDAEVNVLFVDEPSIAELNQRFMGHEGSTDVLSFPIDEDPPESGRHPDAGGTGPGDPSDPDDMPMLLGDIVVCPEVAARNAPDHADDRHDGSFDDEVALLLVHGILHLLGMDHEDNDEAEEMEARERAHLARAYKPPPDGTPAPPLEPRTRTGPVLPPRSSDSITLEQLSRGELPSHRSDDED